MSISLEEKDLKHIWHPCSQMKDYEKLPPIVIDHAKGMYLYDIHGKKYMDIISSWWCNLFGHCNERINTALKNQVDNLEHVIFANFSHKPAIELCELLCEVLPKGLNKFLFTDNGSSAIEAAIKLSFQYHYQVGEVHRKTFMSLSDAYHGETVGALSVSGMDLYAEIFKPLLFDIVRVDAPDCYRCKYGKCRESCNAECFESAEKAFEQYGNVTSGFIIEPIVQGAAGMRMYSPIYLKKLRKICDKYNVHLIDDEIAMGYGRTGKMFGCDHADISPDIMCVSKGLTGGYLPMALCISTDEIYNAFYDDYNKGKAFMHSHTYSGNALACSVAVEILKILKEEKIIENSQDNRQYFKDLVYNTFKDYKYAGDIRSQGLINAIELVEDKNTKKPFDSKKRIGYQVYKKALEKGLLLRPIGDILYFNPPLTIEPDEMQFAVKTCLESIKEVLDE